MLLGDPDADNTLEVGEIYLSTAEGWVELSGDGTGGVVVDLIDAPEGHTDE